MVQVGLVLCTLLVATVFSQQGIKEQENSAVSASSKGETGIVPDLQGSELLLGALLLKGLLLKGKYKKGYHHGYNQGYHTPSYYGYGHGGYGGYGGYGGHGYGYH